MGRTAVCHPELPPLLVVPRRAQAKAARLELGKSRCGAEVAGGGGTRMKAGARGCRHCEANSRRGKESVF